MYFVMGELLTVSSFVKCSWRSLKCESVFCLGIWIWQFAQPSLETFYKILAILSWICGLIPSSSRKKISLSAKWSNFHLKRCWFVCNSKKRHPSQKKIEPALFSGRTEQVVQTHRLSESSSIRKLKSYNVSNFSFGKR